MRRRITSYSVHKPRFVDHNRQPSAISPQNNRTWPRVETAFATMSRKAINSNENWTISPKASKPNPAGMLNDTLA